MSIYKTLAGVLALSLMLGSLPASGQSSQSGEKKEQTASKSLVARVFHPVRVRLGGFSFGAGYSRYSGFYPYYAYYPYSFYRPWVYDPFYYSFYGAYPPFWCHPGWYTGFAQQPGMGEIRLLSNLKDADVYIDDGLAGKVKDLKTLWLEPGAYNLKVRAENYEPFTMRVYILSGKSLKVDANLAPQKEP
jgi:hypothetical protein